MFCKNCGTETTGFKFCTSCGTMVDFEEIMKRDKKKMSNYVEKMGFWKTYKKVLRNELGLKGRSRRREYWKFCTVNSIFCFTFFLLTLLSSMLPALLFISVPLVLIYFVISFTAFLAVTVRRLHDIGLNGYWTFIGLIPYLGVFVLTLLFCIDSQKMTNKYGENPKEKESISKFNLEIDKNII